MDGTLTRTSLEQLAAQAISYADESHADATRRAYRSDWSDWTEWCASHGREPLPATGETLALYLADRADRLATSTIRRRLTTIRQAHLNAEVDSPTDTALARRVWKGIRRRLGTRQEASKALVREDLEQVVTAIDGERLADFRDRAILLVGWSSSCRRSELVGLDVHDVSWVSQGAVLDVRKSKTDQEGNGRRVGIPQTHDPLCPVSALQAWLLRAGLRDGALWLSVDRWGNLGTRLSARGLALVLKRRVAGAGLDPSKYSGHSLRSGLATSAAAAGVSERAIMRQTGHRSERTVRRYIQEGGLFRENAAAAALKG